MKNEIELLKGDEKRTQTDLELVKDFFEFLKAGKNSPKLSSNKAFSVIYYLQESFPILPDTIEICEECKELFDSDYEGFFHDHIGHFCGYCLDSVPKEYL